MRDERKRHDGNERKRHDGNERKYARIGR